jgi:hypothetical protein
MKVALPGILLCVSFAAGAATFLNQPEAPGTTLMEYGGEVASTVTMPSAGHAQYHIGNASALMCQRRLAIAEVEDYIHAEQPNRSLIQEAMQRGLCKFAETPVSFTVKRFEAFDIMDGHVDLAFFAIPNPDLGVVINYYARRQDIALGPLP